MRNKEFKRIQNALIDEVCDERERLRARVAELEGENKRLWDQFNEFVERSADDVVTLRARVAELKAALRLLVNDVADYEAWQRPCHALDVARAALAQESGE